MALFVCILLHLMGVCDVMGRLRQCNCFLLLSISLSYIYHNGKKQILNIFMEKNSITSSETKLTIYCKVRGPDRNVSD